MGELDWAKSATELERLIRGLNPWPSAFSHLNGKTLKIWEASVEEENGEKKHRELYCRQIQKDSGFRPGRGF